MQALCRIVADSVSQIVRAIRTANRTSRPQGTPTPPSAAPSDLGVDWADVEFSLARLGPRVARSRGAAPMWGAGKAGHAPGELLEDSLAVALRAPLAERPAELRLHAVVATCVAAYAPETRGHWAKADAAVAETRADIERAARELGERGNGGEGGGDEGDGARRRS